MKLIIEISDESYDKALNGIINCKECFDAIVYGTPIPDNATNGDILKLIFPDGVKTSIAYPRDVSKEWINTPYQKGGKE